MIRQHEDGGPAPPHPAPPIRRRRSRRLLYTIIALILLYLLISYEPIPLPILVRSPKKITYDTYPTYEYVSLYRQKADQAFEAAVDLKLRALERETIEKIPADRHGLATNLTIWQITTQEAADALPLWTVQWRDNNKDWFYNLFTSPPPDLYGHFEGIREITDMNATDTVVQNDLMRYLLLWFHGGFWTEVETWDRVALRDCPPIAAVLAGQKDVSLMLGIDADEPFLSDATLREWKWARGVGFGQAVMWAPMRFDPMLRKAIVRTISHARIHATFEEETWREKYTARVDYTGEISGNGMFTDVVLETLSATLKEGHEMRDRDAGLERRVTWKKFRGLKEVLWLEGEQIKDSSEDEMRGLSVLPINVWGNGKSHSKAGTFEHPMACVNHMPGFRPKQDLKKKVFG
ncbi:glycosyltransferase family 32 protein [Cadophora sp. DSE1049]|nr:glycosyltransferase family 32 protein [Cadophora sp. DSE1049]